MTDDLSTKVSPTGGNKLTGGFTFLYIIFIFSTGVMFDFYKEGESIFGLYHLELCFQRLLIPYRETTKGRHSIGIIGSLGPNLKLKILLFRIIPRQ